MGFPTSDMRAAFGHFLLFRDLGRRFRTRHPDLAGLLQEQEVQPLYLSVPLSRDRSVLLALLRFAEPYDYTPVWTVVGPRPSEPPRIWKVGTDLDVLVDALHSRAVAELEGAEEWSPWRWDEPETGEIVALADSLAACGVDVRMAVARNRYRAVETDRGTKAEYFGSDRGDFLVARGAGHLVRVSLKPLSGWTIDARVEAGGPWRRLDLGGLLLGDLTPVPGVDPGRVDPAELADVVVSLVAGLVADPVCLPVQRPRAGTRPEVPAPAGSAARRLVRLGFTDVVVDGTGSRLDSDTFCITWWKRAKSLGLGDVQRLYGVAAVEGRRLMVVTEGSATSEACAFADRAKAFVFAFDPFSGRLRGCNDLAREVDLDEPSWGLARAVADPHFG